MKRERETYAEKKKKKFEEMALEKKWFTMVKLRLGISVWSEQVRSSKEGGKEIRRGENGVCR